MTSRSRCTVPPSSSLATNGSTAVRADRLTAASRARRCRGGCEPSSVMPPMPAAACRRAASRSPRSTQENTSCAASRRTIQVAGSAPAYEVVVVVVAGAATAVPVASGVTVTTSTVRSPGPGAEAISASPRAAATTASRGRGGTGDHRSRAVSPDRAGPRGWEDLRMDERRPRRPALLGKVALETFGGAPDPAALAEAAHATASLLVESGRATSDEVARARLVALVDEVGLDTIADLWAQRPPRSLPGALWRLYVLREWVQRDAVAAALDF